MSEEFELSQDAQNIWDEAGDLLDLFEISEADLAGLDEDGIKKLRKRIRTTRLANIGVLMERDDHLVSALWGEVARRRERYVRNLSNKLVRDGFPVDQREIDFQRGIWYGQMLALVALPREAKKAREQQREDERDEEANS